MEKSLFNFEWLRLLGEKEEECAKSTDKERHGLIAQLVRAHA